MGYYSRSSVLTGFEAVVAGLGGNPVSLLNAVGIHPQQLHNPEEFIGDQLILQVLENSAAQCRCPSFGLELARRQGLASLGLIGVYIMRQASIEKALVVVTQYAYTQCGGLNLHLDRINHDRCCLSMSRCESDYRHNPQKVQLCLALLHRCLRELIGPSWQLQSVEVTQCLDAPLQERFERFFGCSVVGSGQRNAIQFPPQFLQCRPRQQLEMIDQVLGHQISTHLAVTRSEDILVALERAIRTLLPTGDCSLEAAALSLNLHPKKLQRELRRADTSYRALLESVRKQEATKELQRGDMSISHLALHLGYAEFSVFSRQFKQWYGVAPTRWRPGPTLATGAGGHLGQ
ncbi:AraC family transcriptional regulator [Aestuariicella hydrocarbonica]|uniref:AraC family transcriptional regulator n=1 Tax=Pseudomaricurvus hydrocarbonicus TaxID=1470433 RepID=A0A9E5JTT0_9GAMM|nr:AraC family transcriptional regulator [Aestuariicella hydrocarbonica]NHO65164.1 AraC family transcriptional regulator [Aestuariicella hydrocarbonica]